MARTKRQYSDSTAARYFLTAVKHQCRCAACGFRMVPGGDMVYRRLGPVTLCVSCADADPLVDYRPSIRWEQRRQKAQTGRRDASPR